MNIKQAFLNTSATGYLNAAKLLALFGLGATTSTAVIVISEKTLPCYYPYLMSLVAGGIIIFMLLAFIRMGMND